ncbi:hypothetical protein BC835DRAFT_1415451 [Cytidiella melzeri]|nr:hypothetical protein BC835DRAFT_1415451 [Cytidiella melzeri]
MLISSSPSTPSSHRSFTAFGHPPINSSPLAPQGGSSPVLSPTSIAQERRRSQYKTVARSSPTVDRTRSSSRRLSAPPPRLESSETAEEAPGKKFLRERFKARCLDRAVKDRERKISGKRRASDWSSDGPDEMMDWDDEDEDEDESMLNDAFFSRIMASVKHQRQHSYRVSYAQDVGSSFDPDIEDLDQWEHELRAEDADNIPDDIDEEDLQAYAAEHELLEGLTVDDLFTCSDVDDAADVDDHAELCGAPGMSSGADVEMEL